MTLLDILDVKVKLIRKGIGSSTGNKPNEDEPGGEVVVSTTAVLGAAKLGTMKLGET